MRPSLTAFDPTDCVAQNAVFCGDDALQSGVLPDCDDLRKSQFRGSATFASVSGSMPNFVSMIILRCIPSKVADMIICCIPVVVAALHSCWSLPDKRLQNKPMWARYSDFIIAPQTQIWARVAFGNCRFLQFSGSNGSHAPMIGNLINPLKVNYIAPFFHFNPHSQNMGIL